MTLLELIMMIQDDLYWKIQKPMKRVTLLFIIMSILLSCKRDLNNIIDPELYDIIV